jgi:hypothetical protein
MNKIIYTLGFLLIFSFFNNEAKAQSSDIDKCSLVSGAVNVTTLAAATDKTCDTTGATKLSFQLHNLGFCTSAPNIKFQTGGKAADQRDSSVSNSYSEGTSDLSSCTFTIKQTSSTDEILESVGEVEPLPIDELPPKGTYTHAVIVFSNVVKVRGYTQFSTTIRDTLSEVGNPGTYCWTNGAEILEVGSYGPKITVGGTTGAAGVGGGAQCGLTLPLAQAGQAENTITYMMNNFRTDDTTEAAQCRLAAGCDTTRSRENTTLGTLDLFFTKVSSFTTPTINRATINSVTETSDANTITLVFGFNNPIVVTDETTGMDIKVNFDYALSVDFENVTPRGAGASEKKNGAADGEAGYTATKRIRLLGAGPFGIAFVPTQGGGVD